MELAQAIRSTVGLWIWVAGKIVSIAIWMVGARFRLLRQVVKAKKSARKAAQVAEREIGKRLKVERDLVEAKAARDTAIEFWREQVSGHQQIVHELMVWAGRQAVGYGPGEGIPEHLVKSALAAPPVGRLTARQMTMKMTEEALYNNGTREQ